MLSFHFVSWEISEQGNGLMKFRYYGIKESINWSGQLFQKHRQSVSPRLLYSQIMPLSTLSSSQSGHNCPSLFHRVRGEKRRLFLEQKRSQTKDIRERESRSPRYENLLPPAIWEMEAGRGSKRRSLLILTHILSSLIC